MPAKNAGKRPIDLADALRAHLAPTIEADEEAEDMVDPAEEWAIAEKKCERAVRRAAKQKNVAITIPAADPFAIAFISDQHIQTDGPTAMARMREDAELVAATPGLYAMLGGDGIDNHIKHRTAMIAAGSRPKRQWALYDHYLGMFGAAKILGVISGNHDNWTQHFADVDMVQHLARAKRIFYAQDELLATVTAGPMTVRVALRHQFRMNSTINVTHANKQWWNYGTDNWDIGVLCHHHELGCDPFFRHGRLRWALRPGAYQFLSGYSREYGYNPATPSCPTAIVRPRLGRVLCIHDVREAADYLTWLRNRKGE